MSYPALRLLGAALAALSVAACATPQEHGPTPEGFPRPAPQPPIPGPYRPEPPQRIEVSALPGWALEDHDAAFAAWRATCSVARDPAMADVCARARSAGQVAPGDGRTFLERAFVAGVGGDGATA